MRNGLIATRKRGYDWGEVFMRREKDATYGFKRLRSAGLLIANVVDNGAIQVSLQQIIATFVYGHFTLGLIHVEFEVYVSSLHEIDSGG
jgi:hypothetical protein